MNDIIDRKQAKKLTEDYSEKMKVVQDLYKENRKQKVLITVPKWIQELTFHYIHRAIQNSESACLIPIQGYENAMLIHELAWALGYVANVYIFSDFCVAENKKNTKRRQKRIYKVIIHWR